MKSWASDAILGASRRETLIRAVLALVVLGAVFWLLPIRRPGEDGGHHGPTPALDPFEKAGVVELKEGQPAPAFTLGTLDGGRASLTDHRDKLVRLPGEPLLRRDPVRQGPGRRRVLGRDTGHRGLTRPQRPRPPPRNQGRQDQHRPAAGA